MPLPSEDKIKEIRRIFHDLYPEDEYGDIAGRISSYWTDMLRNVWRCKPEHLKKKDIEQHTSDPLSRIPRTTMVIAYADSVYQEEEKTLQTLDRFLREHFPAAAGIHVLPACLVADERFNDGFFSQIERTRIHPRFGSNRDFENLMESRVSMADFVLNHVDIENPVFQAYLKGDETSGRCFYVFSEQEYRKRLADGDFDNIFRPRPYPLFTIFRREPTDPRYHGLCPDEKIDAATWLLQTYLDDSRITGILSIFNKVGNDQMLLDQDYHRIVEFRKYMKQKGLDPDSVFKLSEIQETSHPPYIFREAIKRRSDLLLKAGYEESIALKAVDAYEKIDRQVFGQEIRALTTFSHVQVDVNTSTFEGLKMVADDFSWYLGMDVNLLRLDAAHYAFKKWKTSCFGLPEVRMLLRILNLSMEAVSPGMTANLEINDRLESVLCQLEEPSCQAPVMYDFHLASVLPAVFIFSDTEILDRAYNLIKKHKTPGDRIRFTVIECHDGKSLRGGMDIMTISEQLGLIDTVRANGGEVKYKASPARRLKKDEFEQICSAAGLDPDTVRRKLFLSENDSSGFLYLKDHLCQPADIAAELGIPEEKMNSSSALFLLADRLVRGREPYELCTSTWDSMPRLQDVDLECSRFLAFYTLGFALAGRNIKSVYFNDLAALPNDFERMKKTGELRDIKRTRIKPSYLEVRNLTGKIRDPASVRGIIARGLNELIEITDNDAALAPRAKEAEPLCTNNRRVAAVYNRCGENCSITVVNTSLRRTHAQIDAEETFIKDGEILAELITGQSLNPMDNGKIRLDLKPFQRLWLKPCKAS